jgi:hypothetical protein
MKNIINTGQTSKKINYFDILAMAKKFANKDSYEAKKIY